MKKSYEALSVDVVKFEAQDVITTSANKPDAPIEYPRNQDGQL